MSSLLLIREIPGSCPRLKLILTCHRRHLVAEHLLICYNMSERFQDVICSLVSARDPTAAVSPVQLGGPEVRTDAVTPTPPPILSDSTQPQTTRRIRELVSSTEFLDNSYINLPHNSRVHHQGSP